MEYIITYTCIYAGIIYNKHYIHIYMYIYVYNMYMCICMYIYMNTYVYK